MNLSKFFKRVTPEAAKKFAFGTGSVVGFLGLGHVGHLDRERQRKKLLDANPGQSVETRWRQLGGFGYEEFVVVPPSVNKEPTNKLAPTK